MYARVRTDNMSGTQVGKDLVSAMYYVSEKATEIENGNVVTIGGLIEGEREIRKATTPTSDTALRDLALVASPEVIKNKNYYGLGEYINKAGSAIRCYRLTPGSIFSVTAEALEGSGIEVGYVVEAMAGTKMSVVNSATGATKIGTVIAIEDDWYVIEVA